MVSIIKCGQIIRTSKNLRGIVEYARKHSVRRVESVPLPDGKGTARVFFSDGAESRVIFASHTVLVQWIESRRMFRGAERKAY